jgi:hypothetical protein
MSKLRRWPFWRRTLRRCDLNPAGPDRRHKTTSIWSDSMTTSTFRYLSALILSVVLLAGCASKGSEFLGSWVNTKDPTDSFQVVRNGDEFLIVNNGNKIGATYEKGSLEVKGILVSAELTYDRKTDTILTPGFFGQTEYRRKK